MKSWIISPRHGSVRAVRERRGRKNGTTARQQTEFNSRGYTVVAVSLYRDDVERLERLARARVGRHSARSSIIREALRLLESAV